MKQCAICGKKSALVGHLNKLRGKFNPAPLRRQRPNFQWVRLNGKKTLACSKCIKAMAKTKA